ncbi:SDR family oxidoreductase [Paenibacillus gorillae]|uniref:SDR family oxidoreductase n=1 Tax=Paenibacillus gorillae TaxID=1243662 RepID=UPI0004B70F2E|nr:aldehyde reductase [Paenibacillus gorillae]
MQDQYKQTVLVTGGTGFVAGWAIYELIRQGYKVRTTVRSKEKELSVLNMLSGVGIDTSPLSFHIAELTSDEGWDAAMAGVDYVLHIASPLVAGDPDDLDAFVIPARDGALRVLRAAVNANVERVVMTSSLAAATPDISSEDQQVNETFWSDPNDNNLNAYRKSKAIAEKAAWDYMKEHTSKTTLTTVLPGAIFGPILSASVPSSIGVIQKLVQGEGPGHPNIGFEIIDVRDLVDLHIRAMTEPKASGQRYIAVNGYMMMIEMAKFLKQALGEAGNKIAIQSIPDSVLKDAAKTNPSLASLVPMLGRKFRYTSNKAKSELDWSPRPAEETVLDSANKLIDFHLI